MTLFETKQNCILCNVNVHYSLSVNIVFHTKKLTHFWLEKRIKILFSIRFLRCKKTKYTYTCDNLFSSAHSVKCYIISRVKKLVDFTMYTHMYNTHHSRLPTMCSINSVLFVKGKAKKRISSEFASNDVRARYPFSI